LFFKTNAKVVSTSHSAFQSQDFLFFDTRQDLTRGRVKATVVVAARDLALEMALWREKAAVEGIDRSKFDFPHDSRHAQSFYCV
jgi:hypothetical protein